MTQMLNGQEPLVTNLQYCLSCAQRALADLPAAIVAAGPPHTGYRPNRGRLLIESVADQVRDIETTLLDVLGLPRPEEPSLVQRLTERSE